MKFTSILYIFLLIVCTAPIYSQQTSLESAFVKARLTLTLDKGKVGGEGFAWLKERALKSQFLVFGETHARAEIPELIGAFYNQLYDQGFHYLALEMGPHIATTLSGDEYLGKKGKIKKLASLNPNAIAFAYDEELAMLAEVSENFKGAGEVFWGLDYAYGGKHLVRELQILAKTENQEKVVKQVLKNIKKSKDGHEYITNKLRTQDILSLKNAFQPSPDSKAYELIATLETSNRIYHNWVKAYKTKVDRLAGFDNSSEREALMKSQFLKQYRKTQKVGVDKPKVIFKFGGAHIQPAIMSNYVPSLGSFIKDFAITENSQATVIGMVHLSKKNSPTEGLLLTLKNASNKEISLFDFTMLRNSVLQNKYPDIPADLKKAILTYDAMIVVPDSKKAGINNYIKAKIRNLF